MSESNEQKDQERAGSATPADTGDGGAQGEETRGPAEPKWTDAKVDAYVKRRIDKQNERHGEELADANNRAERAEEALAAVTRERDRQAVALECGLPVEQVHGATLDEMRANAESLKSYIGTLPIYPTHKGGDDKPAVTREGIMAIKDKKERREAIKAHIQLFE